MSILGPLIGGVAGGATSGAFGLFGNKGQSGGPSTPNLLSPTSLLSIGAALYNAYQQSQTQQEYERKADKLIQDSLIYALQRAPQGLSIYDSGTEDVANQLRGLRDRVMETGNRFSADLSKDRNTFLGDVAKRGGEAAQGFGIGIDSLLGTLSGERASLDQEYQGYENRALDELAGAGTQAKADVNRAFDENAGVVGQDLLNRGLASSTEAAKEYGGNTERRSAELRRLDESLAREKIGVLQSFGAPRLAAKERGTSQAAGYRYGAAGQAFSAKQNLDNQLAAYDAALRGDVQRAKELTIGYDRDLTGNLVNWQSGDATNRANLYNQGTGDVLRTLSGINYLPPQPNQLNFQFGQNLAPTPQTASPYSSFFANLAPGVGQLGGAIASRYFNSPPVRSNPNAFSAFPGFENAGYYGPQPSPDWYN